MHFMRLFQITRKSQKKKPFEAKISPKRFLGHLEKDSRKFQILKGPAALKMLRRSDLLSTLVLWRLPAYFPRKTRCSGDPAVVICYRRSVCYRRSELP